MSTKTSGFLSLMKSLPANVNLETSTVSMPYIAVTRNNSSVLDNHVYREFLILLPFFTFNITSSTCLFACLVGTAKSP